MRNGVPGALIDRAPSRILRASIVVASLASCYQSHLRSEDASLRTDDVTSEDASGTDAPSTLDAVDAPTFTEGGAVDTNPPRLDTGGARCDRTGESPLGPSCSPAAQAACVADAMRWANGRYGHATCRMFSGEPWCVAGDYCDAVNCRCSAHRQCVANDEVCVSDTPDGPTRCVPRCSGR